MVTSIVLYTLVWYVSYLLVKHRFDMLCLKVNIKACEPSSGISKQKMPYWMIILICLLLVGYDYYVTTSNASMGGDRSNYLYNFDGERETPSKALSAILGLLWILDGSFEDLLYISMFVSVFITLLAYRLSEDATPKSILFLFFTQYFLTFLTALKQCYASAIATLVIVLLLQKKSRIKEIIIFMLMVLAALFHSAGYLLFLIYFLIRYPKSKYNIRYIIIILVIVVVLFMPIMSIFSSIIGSLLPQLSSHVDSYFGKDATVITEGSVFSFIRGTPFFIITWLGYRNLNRLESFVPNYYNYFLISLICSLFYFLDIYNGWMSRFTYLFSFVSFVFYFRISKYLKCCHFYNLIIGLSAAVVTYRFLFLVYSLSNGF